ncbi:MAG: histidine kinase [Rhodopseudomonas palustris]|nr:histidine kinase [Rhodopseudomonas palustris]
MTARDEAHRDAAGKVVRVMGVIWDITERRAAEARARETADRLQLAALGAGIGSWERLFDGERGVWDAQMYRLFGATRRRTASRTWCRCAAWCREDWPAIDRAAPRGAAAAASSRRPTASGAATAQIRWLSGRGRTRYGADGAPLSIVGVNWDITERTRRRGRAARQARRPSAASRGQERVPVAHEPRAAHAAERDARLRAAAASSTATSRCRRAARAGRPRSAPPGWHLLTLINDVLDLSRIEAGELTRRRSQPVTLAPAGARRCRRWSSRRPRRAASASAARRRRAGRSVLADPTRLRQVLLNLLSNAVKYNRAGGQVQRRAARRTASRSRCAVRRHRARHERRAAAPAVPAVQPARRRAARHRGHRHRPGDRASALVEQMGGAIEVRSQRRASAARFARALRAAAGSRTAAPAPAARPTPAVDARRRRRHALLYIEDNPVNALLVAASCCAPRRDLRAARRRPTAPTAWRWRALRAAGRWSLLDMQPARHRRLRGAAPAARRTPATARRFRCVALSANAMPDDIERALRGRLRRLLDQAARRHALPARHRPAAGARRTRRPPEARHDAAPVTPRTREQEAAAAATAQLRPSWRSICRSRRANCWRAGGRMSRSGRGRRCWSTTRSAWRWSMPPPPASACRWARRSARALARLTAHVDQRGRRQRSAMPLRVLPVTCDDFSGWFVDAAGALPLDADADRAISQRLADSNLRLREIQRRRTLERQMLGVAEQEKRRVSLELHDGLGQHLAGVAFVVRSLADAVHAGKTPEASEVDWLQRLINEAVSRTRSLARGLWPASLERGSLGDSIRRFAEDLESIYGVSCAVQIDAEPQLASPAAAYHIFRIVQEASNNAIKHGRARRLRVPHRAAGRRFRDHRPQRRRDARPGPARVGARHRRGRHAAARRCHRRLAVDRAASRRWRRSQPAAGGRPGQPAHHREGVGP